jgi:hypothetical protein
MALLVAMLGLLCYLYVKQALRRDRWVLGGALVCATVGAGSAPTLIEAAEALAVSVGMIVLIVAAARGLLRSNLAGYLLAVVSTAILMGGFTLVRTADPWLIANGAALLIVTALGLVGFVVWADKATRPTPEQGGVPNATQ